MEARTTGFRTFGGLTIAQIATSDQDALEYISCGKAIAGGKLHLMEVSPSGSVNTITVLNETGAHVFLMDGDVLTAEDFSRYTTALESAGFFGPDSWYMNHRRNAEFASGAVDGGRLSLPALFLHAEFDDTCETVSSRLAEPMRRDCSDLTEVTVASGHWMAQERPLAVNAALARWLAVRFPELWPA